MNHSQIYNFNNGDALSNNFIKANFIVNFQHGMKFNSDFEIQCFGKEMKDPN